MRTIIIGDIHGCFDEFNSLLKKIKFDFECDMLIINGDLMDRGSKSFECLKLVKELKEKMNKRFVFVRGSHEHQLLHWNKFPKIILWNLLGRIQTVNSFKKHNQKISNEQEWFKNNTVLYYKEKNFQCVHASILKTPIEENKEYTLLLDHKSTPKNSYSGPLTITGHIHLQKPMYFSGDRSTGVELPYGVMCKLPDKGIICIDTCVENNGTLTAIVIEDDSYYLIGQKSNH